MYVDFETFSASAFGGMTADEYARYAPLADLAIDHHTLGRVGACYGIGHALPASVTTAYCALVAATPPALEDAAGGRQLTSYSNGVDSYGFAAATVAEDLAQRTAWVVDMLPVEWISAAVCYEGGCHA